MVETDPEIFAAATLLGGAMMLRCPVETPAGAHEMLRSGMPGQALWYFIDHLTYLQKTSSLEIALGMKLTPYQRHKGAAEQTLGPEESGRVWQFAEVVAKAVSVFGSLHEAEQWLMRPAIGLNRRLPIDLLATTAGAGMVRTLLDRLMYGVYT